MKKEKVTRAIVYFESTCMYIKLKKIFRLLSSKALESFTRSLTAIVTGPTSDRPGTAYGPDSSNTEKQT